MNYCVISGKISSNIDYGIGSNERVCRFRIRNVYFKMNNSKSDAQYIPCRAYGNLAEYCNAELYPDCEVVVIGRIRISSVRLNGRLKNIMYVYCNCVTKIEHRDYD